MNLNKAFRGGSGRIPVAQPQQLAGNQSGNQGANNTTVKMAENLSQGHANSEYDKYAGVMNGGANKKYKRKSKKSRKSKKVNVSVDFVFFCRHKEEES